MSSLLVDVSAHDVVTFVLAPTVLVVVAIVACLVPARAATLVQAVETLRTD